MAHSPHGRVHRFCRLRSVRPRFLPPRRSVCDANSVSFSFARSIGLVLAFVIPRVPDFAINGSNPLSAATGSFNDSVPTQFSRAPANFSFPAQIALQVDTTSNFLPVVFNRLDAQVYDLDTFRLIATGRMNHTKFPAKKFTKFQMPLIFSYVATNDSDAVCKSTKPFLVFLG